MASDVAIVKGDDRKRNIYRSLELIEDRIRLGQRIVVKPNMVSISKPLSATHADALDAALQFIRERTDRDIVVAEGCASADSIKGFRTYGLAEVANRYGALLVDLHCDRWVTVEVFDRDLPHFQLNSFVTDPVNFNAERLGLASNFSYISDRHQKDSFGRTSVFACAGRMTVATRPSASERRLGSMTFRENSRRASDMPRLLWSAGEKSRRDRRSRSRQSLDILMARLTPVWRHPHVSYPPGACQKRRFRRGSRLMTHQGRQYFGKSEDY